MIFFLNVLIQNRNSSRLSSKMTKSEKPEIAMMGRQPRDQTHDLHTQCLKDLLLLNRHPPHPLLLWLWLSCTVPAFLVYLPWHCGQTMAFLRMPPVGSNQEHLIPVERMDREQSYPFNIAIIMALKSVARAKMNAFASHRRPSSLTDTVPLVNERNMAKSE